jgi:hypothetical protein
MLVEEHADAVRLRISDGPGEAAFDDLVIVLEFSARRRDIGQATREQPDP